MYLRGTATPSEEEKGSEPECIDRYLKNDAIENKDYEVCSSEIWEFLSALYGFDFVVRRYY
jgi:hypothetical protein